MHGSDLNSYTHYSNLTSEVWCWASGKRPKYHQVSSSSGWSYIALQQTQTFKRFFTCAPSHVNVIQPWRVIGLVLLPWFYWWQNRGSDWLGDLIKVTQLLGGRAGILICIFKSLYIMQKSFIFLGKYIVRS